ncbi:ABC transporter permease [Pseudactinotalea suaedae]|jgi:NitT/TauT family transport system permease protein|uniref:ABC transporter permease n=1 Tax=Pseudactinotalea suaedae TaxID=1524924 RepID=UPI0012E1C919|nr:ABC transporter permease subunit [Pseudactinotalea suaedae]
MTATVPARTPERTSESPVPPRRRDRRPAWVRALDSTTAYQLLGFALFAVAWQLYGTYWGGLLVPTFTETVLAVGDLVVDPEFWSAFAVSNQALVLGFLAAVVLGVPLGLLLGRFPVAERLSNVYLNILLVTPMAAIIPLLVMSVGFGLASRVILVTIFAIVMVVVNVRSGVRQVDPALLQMARSFGASERQTWMRVLIPGALPSIMTGIRLGLGRAVTGMVIVELLMVSVALGGLILNYRSRFDGAHLYATIVLILIEALVLIGAARWLESRLAPWAVNQRKNG